MTDRPGTTDDLLTIAEELYGLPLSEFTAARDTRARELKGTAASASVKALRKPATAAWVVDLLVRREHDQVTQMLEIGEALRQAQEGMDAAGLRELTKQRRQLTAALTTRARALARGSGLKVTEQVAEQVEATLTAAMIDADAAAAVRSGLLVAPLRATGVGAVDAASAVALPDALSFTAAAVADPPVSLHVVPDPESDPESDLESDLESDRRALEEAQAALAEATAAAETAEASRDSAAAEVERLNARALQVQAELDELRRQVAELEESALAVDDEIADAEEALAEAQEAARVAVQARDEAAAEVARREG